MRRSVREQRLIFLRQQISASGNFLVSLADGVDERFHFCVVLLPFFFLNSGSNVHAPWLQNMYRLGYIFRTQPTGSDKANRGLLQSSKCGFGIETLAGAASSRIEQE